MALGRGRADPSATRCWPYAQESLHAGLVVLIPNVATKLQKRLFKRAVEKLAEFGDPINHVLEVDIDGEDVTFELYELPPAV